MEVFAEYLSHIDDPQHRARLEDIFHWIADKFPNLSPKIAWNQPMFTDHGTFIIGFSIAKHHMACAPERAGIIHFSEDLIKAGFSHTNELIRFPWDSPIDFFLLEKLITFNIIEKADCSTFWRK
jgi:uncharacterized protein